MTELLDSLFAARPDARVGAFAPGRVNLIGEHTDYSGLPVLPFALPLGVGIVASPRADGAIGVHSRDSDRFASEVIARTDLEARPPAHTWVDYVIAGLRLNPPPYGVDLWVAGDLPVASGLSSSAAVVCASAMLFAQGDVDRLQLAERAAAAERYVGTQAGGMDQAASLLGQPGCALLMQFRPLRVEPVPVPEQLAVVVADSGVRAEKGGAAQRAYNERVQQCKLAASAMGALPGGLLADVPGDRRAERARAIPDALLARRAGFVFEEADRVAAAAAALRQGQLAAFGALLDASHRGLRDDYEVSHPAVDALVAAAKAHGALGARIVGAGFGGSAIALCQRQGAAELTAVLRAAGAVAAFAASPSAGARRQER